MTPIFSRSWFVKRQIVSVCGSASRELGSACDISRACRPTCVSPISPSISAFGVSGDRVDCNDVERTRPDQGALRSRAPVRRCRAAVTRRSSMLTPMCFAYVGSIRCSASMKAQMPPRRCCLRDHVVHERRLSDDSGPKISTILPRGSPPIKGEVEARASRSRRSDQTPHGRSSSLLRLCRIAARCARGRRPEPARDPLTSPSLGQTIRRRHTALHWTAAQNGRQRHRTDWT